VAYSCLAGYPPVLALPFILCFLPCHSTALLLLCLGPPGAAAAGVLWSISPKLVLFLLCYAVLGTAGTAALFGRPLTRLQQKILKLEADLRFGLVRLR
jgi:putative ATP-binding cassette transporter